MFHASPSKPQTFCPKFFSDAVDNKIAIQGVVTFFRTGKAYFRSTANFLRFNEIEPEFIVVVFKLISSTSFTGVKKITFYFKRAKLAMLCHTRKTKNTDSAVG
jgi:hypothetical protein